MIISKEEPLAQYTSFDSGGNAKNFAVVKTTEDVIKVIQDSPRPFWLIGSGANSVISDEGLPGTTMLFRNRSIEVSEDGAVTASSGAIWDDLVKESIARDLWGLETTSGIPGTVGAAIAGNIAAYGQAVSNTLVSVQAIDYNSENPQVFEIPADELDLEYRSSKLSRNPDSSIVILSTTFKLSSAPTTEFKYEKARIAAREGGFDTSTLAGRRQAIMLAREKAGSLLDDQHPQKTAGSFFKNPMVTRGQAEELLKFEEFDNTREAILTQNKIHGGSESRISASFVILAAGFQRGQSWGPVRIHPDHVLKLENTGGATSRQIYDVAQEIINTTREKLDITLEPEVKFLGNFS